VEVDEKVSGNWGRVGQRSCVCPIALGYRDSHVKYCGK